MADRVRCADCANARISPGTYGEHWRCVDPSCESAPRGRVYLETAMLYAHPDSDNPDGFRHLLRKARHCDEFASMD